MRHGAGRLEASTVQLDALRCPRLRSKAHLRPLGYVGGACIAWSAPLAVAEAAPPVAVEGTCPGRDVVEAVLRTMLPAADPKAPAAATVTDRGDTFVVSVNGRAKTYPDPERNCSQRARIAAAFIALVLEPGGDDEADRAPPEPKPAPPPPPPREDRAAPSPSTSPPWLHVAVRGDIEVSSSPGFASPGVDFDLGAAWGSFGAEISCAWVAPGEIALAGGGTAVLSRVPCSLGPVVRVTGTPVQVDLKVGLDLGSVRADGQGLPRSHGAARLEAGARFAIDASLRPSRGARVWPVAGLQISYYPVPYDLVVTPQGVVASTPGLWAGATAGVGFGAL